jgi:hypothetical protein
MNIVFGLFLVVLAVLGFKTVWTSRPRGRGLHGFANEKSQSCGVKPGNHRSGYVTAAGTHLYYLYGQGATDDTYTLIAANTTKPVGVVTDYPGSTTRVYAFDGLLGADRTVLMVASATVSAGALVYSYGDGTVRTLTVSGGGSAGTYWCVGMAMTTSDSGGGIIEVAPTLQYQPFTS